MAKAPKPGLYPGLDYAIYASWPALRSSTARLFARSPLHAHAALSNPGVDKPSDAKDLGEVAHCALLEPAALEERFCVWRGGHRGHHPGKEQWAIFQAENASKKIVDAEEYDEALRLRDSIWRQPWAEALISSKGYSEASILWRDPEFDELCKVRPDRFIADYEGWPTIGEIKTSVDASPEKFARQAANLDYHVQAAMELDSVGPHPTRLLWIVLEKGPPWAAALYEPDDEMLDEGRRRYKHALACLKECRRSGIWPGYDTRPRAISLPPWARQKPGAQGGSDDVF